MLRFRNAKQLKPKIFEHEYYEIYVVVIELSKRNYK